ncbi:MAG: phosphoribosylformylglycinamidine synthase [Eubacteriaceae bacterium]|jgi:phosphoribosylformylglycinamidine synthase|nr:phosphoribosylformylglycinamidine synthase [Eubacteriaceae bacterium]
MSKVLRIFVEKKQEYNTEAQKYFFSIKNHLKIPGLTGLRLLNRYDVQGLSEEEFERVKYTVFAEANTDCVYEEEIETDFKDTVFAVAYLPGQYDQRADSAIQCVQIMTRKEDLVIKNARIFILTGDLQKEDIKKIKEYIINPVDSEEVSMEKAASLTKTVISPEPIQIVDAFLQKNEEELKELIAQLGLAMSIEDILFIQKYYIQENRDPTLTELKVLDTYWSDHCRHTTFHTHLTEITIEEGRINQAVQRAYESYCAVREELYAGRDKPLCLMDLATIYAKKARKDNLLNDLEISDEINACSVKVKANVDGKEEDWLVMFKNETHNHPTEIEPFGGAATCLGGAIRDPLSGRSYVYQSMRVTGSGDCTEDIEKTMEGKLPQIKITTEAADGFSSYGNQIGLATGQVKEYYHEGFKAKRMEVGAVIAAARAENVKRLEPEEGDVILLLGGKTGRDGIGGAVGSSKAHTDESVEKSGSEVQKGNPVEERKLQRLFKNPQAAQMIKKCNDFGAGGVSVAIGELADSLEIDLDAVPKKYEGLDGTEIALSESQERMAVLLEAKDVAAFQRLAQEENLTATVVAKVTDSNRLCMFWRGEKIVDISRTFLDTNGASRTMMVRAKEPKPLTYFHPYDKNGDLTSQIEKELSDLNIACNKGLAEQFDSTIGAASVLVPYGGAHQLSPVDGMVAKLPAFGGETTTVSAMTHGYNPYLAEQSTFHGGVYSVITALSKLTSLGINWQNARLTMQEYFEKLSDDPEKWAKPFTALLGAFEAQSAMQTPAIGGKDSMSGTFLDKDVPPNIICFAVAMGEAKNILSPEIKNDKSMLVLLPLQKDDRALPCYEYAKKLFSLVFELIQDKKILSAKTLGLESVFAALVQMGVGNKIGISVTAPRERLFCRGDGDIIVEIADKSLLATLDDNEVVYHVLGHTQDTNAMIMENSSYDYERLISIWQKKLNQVFPIKAEFEETDIPQICVKPDQKTVACHCKTAKPKVFIPAFPGTNCEEDSARAFERAGAKTEIFVFNNLSTDDIKRSLEQMAAKIKEANIVMLPGGFSAGDEPDGSGKFIVSVFKNEMIKEQVHELLDVRGGLMLGICNGFQALVKLGLLPYGKIVDIEPTSPTLTFNTIGRHISAIPYIKVTSQLSPWLKNAELGGVYRNILSHGEGRFVANEAMLKQLKQNNQIAFQYVDAAGVARSDSEYNPNGSVWAIEGITSPDGRILGKMGHSERIGKNLYKNIPGQFDLKLFDSAMEYFK